MVERYTLEEMGNVFSTQHKMEVWLKVELLVIEAYEQLGVMPKGTAKSISSKVKIDEKRALEIEEVVRHDVIAFLTQIGETVGEESKYIHKGLTSSDMLDTALSYVLGEASDLILKKLYSLREVFNALAIKYKETICVGRSHGIHGEPTSFGLKMALYKVELDRDIERFKLAIKEIKVGQISGAVGTMATVDPFIEEYVCEKLGLGQDPVSTQIIQRDRHSFLLNVLAHIGATLEKFSVEVRHLQRTEVLEVEEGFKKGQKGSSAMPHKKNPIASENISGCARVLRGNSIVGQENMNLWHERDISHSSAERIVLPDSFILLDYMLSRCENLAANLVIHEENMLRNLNLTKGLVYSQRILLALLDKGILREVAYDIVQRNAMKTWEGALSLYDNLLTDPEAMEFLTAAEIEKLMDPKYYLRNLDYIYKKANIK